MASEGPTRTHAARCHQSWAALGAGWVRMGMGACLLLLAATAVAAQQRDSARVGAGARPAPAAAPVAMLMPPDSLRPPISPRRAFLSSLLLPGLGQASMDRPFGTALFATVEAGALLMLIKSRFDLDAARRGQGDSVVVRYELDPATGQPVPAEFEPGPFTEELVRARKLHYEDWLFVLIFNHVIAGADAFVAAQLWDVPTSVSASMTRDGAAISARLRW